MNPHVTTNNLFRSLLDNHSSETNTFNLTPESCKKMLSEIQSSRGIPMIAIATWLSESDQITPNLKDYLRSEFNTFRVAGTYRTSCVSLDKDGYLFMRKDQSVVLQQIPTSWNSDMELHELIEQLRIEDQDRGS